MEEISAFKTATLTARHPAERRYCQVNFLRAKPGRFTSRQKPPFQDAEAELFDAGHDCARTSHTVRTEKYRTSLFRQTPVLTTPKCGRVYRVVGSSPFSCPNNKNQQKS